MKTKVCENPYHASRGLLRAFLCASITASVLFATSCKTIATTQKQTVERSDARTDSVSQTVERLTKAIPVPSSRATLTLSFDSLTTLPAGAGFIERSGQATVAIVRAESGEITASATCDSLTLLVDELRTEIFHLNAKKTEIKSEVNEQKIIEVNRLTPWQSVQIWFGWICLAMLVIVLGFKLFKYIKL